MLTATAAQNRIRDNGDSLYSARARSLVSRLANQAIKPKATGPASSQAKIRSGPDTRSAAAPPTTAVAIATISQ